MSSHTLEKRLQESNREINRLIDLKNSVEDRLRIADPSITDHLKAELATVNTKLFSEFRNSIDLCKSLTVEYIQEISIDEPELMKKFEALGKRGVPSLQDVVSLVSSHYEAQKANALEPEI